MPAWADAAAGTHFDTIPVTNEPDMRTAMITPKPTARISPSNRAFSTVSR